MDWNDDGRLDIIVGDRLGSVSYFRGLLSSDIYMVAEPHVSVGGVSIDVGYNSSPSVFDWNSDGLPDLIVGRAEGVPAGMYLFLNQGALGEPLFLETDTVMCNGEPIQVYYSYPDFFDMDGDGLEDLVLGSSNGKIACYPNEGVSGVPLFQESQFLMADGEEINFYSYVRPSVCDWNEDGRPDILASDYTGMIYLFLGLPGTGINDEHITETPGIILSVTGNPVSDLLRVTLELPDSYPVTISVYSIDGRLIFSSDRGILSDGVHSLEFDTTDMPGGIFILDCSGGSDQISTTFTVVR